VITIVTHAAMPDGPPDDGLLADELAARGAETRLCVWDDPDVDWAKSPLTIVRSTWDYHRHPRAWFDWLDRVAAVTRLINPAEILRWNSRKPYLLDLAARGVGTISWSSRKWARARMVPAASPGLPSERRTRMPLPCWIGAEC